MKIEIEIQGIAEMVMCREGQTIMDALKNHALSVSAVCGGKGRCGKCGIQVLEGSLPIQKADEEFFTPEELKKGYRLSCLAKPTVPLKIRILAADESEFEILSDSDIETDTIPKEKTGDEKAGTAYGIAIDIGTTTLAAILLDLHTGEKAASSVTINGQRAFGADVISRIAASNQGERKELQNRIREDLQWLVQDLITQGNISPELIQGIAIGGNTTMGHLLMGYSCETLGVFPFTPINNNTITENYATMIGGNLLQCKVTLLPGISAFVGGDIVSGLLACGFYKQDKICLLIDLGTNGEIVLGNKDRILVTSTAAGPAFEGGSISCGIGSIPGAICHVAIENGEIRIRTIKNKPPIGLCGTGVIETMSELLKDGLVDDTGLLDEDYSKQGICLAQSESGKEIRFTQKDIREIQLAKSAVRAGIETLLLRYGITYEEVDTVYLAGGFGYEMDKEKAVQIGLLPEKFLPKLRAVGNSSLTGAMVYLTDPEASEKIKEMLRVSEETALSTDKEFNEFYMQHMMFESRG